MITTNKPYENIHAQHSMFKTNVYFLIRTVSHKQNLFMRQDTKLLEQS